MKIVYNNLLHFPHILFSCRDISIVTSTLSAILDVHRYAETQQVQAATQYFYFRKYMSVNIVKTETFKGKNDFSNDFPFAIKKFKHLGRQREDDGN